MEEIRAALRAIVKFLLSVMIIAAFFIRAFFIKIRFRHDVVAQRRAFSENSSYHCGLLNRVLNIEVSVKGTPVANTNFLYVGNHMGFVDIFVLSSVVPALFITSQEMRETPLLGSICEMGGCIFVERRSRTRIMNEFGMLKESLEQGHNVVLYPEAEATNGEMVLPFKKTLMMAGPHAGRPIQPGCVNFIEVNGQEFNLYSRDHVCWYGEMSFVTAAWNFLRAESIRAELEFLEPIHESPQADRSVVAARAHALVSSRFRPPRGVSKNQVS